LHAVAAVLTAILFVAVLRIQTQYETVFAAQQARAHASGLALENGIDDPDLVRVLYPDPPFVYQYMAAIRQRRLSIFADHRPDWLGQPMSRLFVSGSSTLCAGNVDSLGAVSGGYRATGWAVDRTTDRPPQDIIFTDAAGTIVGFGETRSGGYPRENSGARGNWVWTGFARDNAMGTIRAYVIVRGLSQACPLGPPRQAPRTSRIGPV